MSQVVKEAKSAVEQVTERATEVLQAAKRGAAEATRSAGARHEEARASAAETEKHWQDVQRFTGEAPGRRTRSLLSQEDGVRKAAERVKASADKAEESARGALDATIAHCPTVQGDAVAAAVADGYQALVSRCDAFTSKCGEMARLVESTRATAFRCHIWIGFGLFVSRIRPGPLRRCETGKSYRRRVLRGKVCELQAGPLRQALQVRRVAPYREGPFQARGSLSRHDLFVCYRIHFGAK